MAEKVKNMTTGNPAKLILLFALPMMAGNVFQQMYTLTDTLIVGRFLGVDSLAAVGSCDWLNWMILGSVLGFAQGFSIQIAQEFGAGDYQSLRKTLAASIYLSVILSVIGVILSESAVYSILQLMGTPEEIIGRSCGYLRILFGGMPIVMAYNVAASVLRSLGNSRTPLIAMIIASLLNIALDVVFIAVFHMGVYGAAAATVTAQLVAFLFCFRVIRQIDFLKLQKEDWKQDRIRNRNLLRLGAPIAFQNIIIAIGGVFLQSLANSFGVTFIAGFTATNKLFGILEAAGISYGFAVATYSGQNQGAKRQDRIRKGVFQAAGMGILTASVIAGFMLILGKLVLRQFLSGSPEEVAAALKVAIQYLNTMAVCLPILYLLYNYRSALQGVGDTVLPMVSGFLELAARLGTAIIVSRIIGYAGIFIAEVAAWLAAAVFLIGSYYYRMRELESKETI